MPRWLSSANLQWVHYSREVRDYANAFFYNEVCILLKYGSTSFIPGDRVFAYSVPIRSGNDWVAVKRYRPLT
jgi:hypothetical protein